MLQRIASVLLACSLTVVVACGSDLPTGSNSGDPLAQAEVQELLAEFFDIFEDIDTGIPGLRITDPRLSFSSAGVPIDETFGGTDSCDLGGSTSVSGTVTGDVDTVTSVGEAVLEATVDFTDCVVAGETTTFTIQGDPEIGVRAEFDFTEDGLGIGIDVQGGFAFVTGDDRSGTCALDLNVTIGVSGLTFTESVSGSVCGVNASGLDTELFDDDF